jgi:hypothetical protein
VTQADPNTIEVFLAGYDVFVPHYTLASAKHYPIEASMANKILSAFQLYSKSLFNGVASDIIARAEPRTS